MGKKKLQMFQDRINPIIYSSYYFNILLIDLSQIFWSVYQSKLSSDSK